MTTGTRFNLPYVTVVDGTGTPIPGALLYFYVTGTSTPQNTYSDVGLTMPNTNPVIANQYGVFPSIFLTAAAYKVVLTDQFSNQIWTADPVENATQNLGTAAQENLLNPSISDDGDGNLRTNWPLSTSSGTIAVGAASHQSQLIASGASIFDLAATSTLWSGWAVSIYAQGGAITLTPTGLDKIQGGTGGGTYSVEVGTGGLLGTDAQGNFWFTSDIAAVQTVATAAAAAQTTANSAVAGLPTTFKSAITAIGSTTSFSFAHGLAAKPDLVFAKIINTTSEFSFNIGDEVMLTAGPIPSQGFGPDSWADPTNIGLDINTGITILAKGSSTAHNITGGNWSLQMIAVTFNH